MSSTEVSEPTSPVKKSLMAYRGDIEGLRAVAIVMVVFYHVHIAGFNGGFVGVDIFFVLSGYLITNLLVKEVERTGRLNIAGFYARRLRRLMPASLLMVAVTILAACFLLSPLEQAHIFGSAVATLSYVSNFYFIHQSLDYLGSNTELSPFLHTWSLAVEEQFYFVWPLVILFTLRRKSSRTRLTGALAAITVLSLVASIYLTYTHQVWAFFGSPCRAWEFGIGGLGCLIPSTVLKSKGRTIFLGVLGSALLLYSLLFFNGDTRFPGYAALIPAIGTVLLLIAGSGTEQTLLGRLLSSAPFKFMGGLSYSWYLWHWPALVIATSIYAGKLPLLVGIYCMIGSLAVAFVAHHLVENPIRFNPRLSKSAGLTTAFAALGIAISFAGLVVWHSWVHRQPQYKTFAYAENDTAHLPNCAPDPSGITMCTVGAVGSPTVVLFGDSHAEQWTPPLEQLAKENGWRLVILTKQSCAAADVQVYHRELGRPDEACPAWRHTAIAKIQELQPAAVILTSYSKGYVEPIGRLAVEDWETGTRATLAALSGAASHLFLIKDMPNPTSDVPVCLARSAWTKSSDDLCTFSRHDGMIDAISKSESEAASGFANVTAIDLTGYLCGTVNCRPEQNGLVRYSDAHHLTAGFTRSLAPVFDRMLTANGSALRAAGGVAQR